MSDPKELNKKEILRILDCIRTHCLDVLNLPLNFTADDIKKNYRQISVLVHPDRCGEGLEEQAKTATAIVNAAKEELENDDSIEIWRKRVAEAEKEVVEHQCKHLTALKMTDAEKLGIDLTSDSLKVTEEDVRAHREFREWVVRSIQEQLVAEEWEKRKIIRARAEAEKEKREEAEKRQRTARAEKAHEEEWEKTTDSRFQSWKSFTQRSSRFQRNKHGQSATSGIAKMPSFQAAFLEKNT